MKNEENISKIMDMNEKNHKKMKMNLICRIFNMQDVYNITTYSYNKIET